ncbi:MAG TPA: hypothetical protein VHX18_09930 [Rhizomicrobium sp.]|jgi:hypothetical protein|nr:hypothetical protein [Rhizomicrobium sp.]
MRPRDLFGVALRVLGVWFVYNACYAGFFLGMKEANLPLNSQVSMTQDKLLVGFYLALAFVLLALADRIVALCYGPDRS